MCLAQVPENIPGSRDASLADVTWVPDHQIFCRVTLQVPEAQENPQRAGWWALTASRPRAPAAAPTALGVGFEHVPCSGSEPPPMLHCSEAEDASPAHGAPAWARNIAVRVPAWSRGVTGGVHLFQGSGFFVAFFFFFPTTLQSRSPALLFQLPLSFFGTRQILSFDAGGASTFWPEYCQGGGGGAKLA